MLEWTRDDFIRVLKQNGYQLKQGRGRGSHAKYVNDKGNHISVPLRIRAVIARRLIKENNLIVDL